MNSFAVNYSPFTKALRMLGMDSMTATRDEHEASRLGLLGYTDEARRGELRCRLVRGEAILTPDSPRRGAVAPDSSRLVSPRLGKTRPTDGYIRYVENDSACHQNAI